VADESRPGSLLSRERLAELSGFSDAEVADIEQAGIIHGTDGGYRGGELTKLQLVKQVADNSGGLEQVIQRYREGGYSLSFLDMVMNERGELSDTTFEAALEKIGVPPEEFEALMRAMGLPTPPLDQPARPDEIDALQKYAQLRALPIPLEARLHALRVTADNLRRVAEVQSDLFRTYVVEPLLVAHKDRFEEGNQLVSEISARANPTAAGLTNWIYQRYLEHETMTSVTERMELAVSGKSPVLHREKDPAVAFVDLTGYTVLTADTGDREAAELAQKFNDLLLDASRRNDGRVVKTMGDGAMLFFDRGRSAVLTGLELIELAPAIGLPPMRVGINRGPVVAQSGDYYGTTINVAARISDYARPNEVLLSQAVLPEGGGEIDLEEIGEVTLKGVAQPVRLFKARQAA
jgi:class 3 adenylate cyclase